MQYDGSFPGLQKFDTFYKIPDSVSPFAFVNHGKYFSHVSWYFLPESYCLFHLDSMRPKE